MPFARTPPPQEVELLVERPEEIARLLRRLALKRNLITVHAPGGAPVLVSAILNADADNGLIVLDSSADEEANARALRFPELRCLGQVDSIGVRFSLQHLAACVHEGMPAFQARMPSSVLHLQRRDYYRLRLPVSRPGECRIHVEPSGEHPAGEVPRTVSLRIVDISAGGVALRVPPEFAGQFAAGSAFDSCTLDLPDFDALRVDMVVRHLAERRYEEGPGIWQAGCEFVAPPRSVQQQVQRFIMQVERELAARAKGKA